MIILPTQQHRSMQANCNDYVTEESPSGSMAVDNFGEKKWLIFEVESGLDLSLPPESLCSSSAPVLGRIFVSDLGKSEWRKINESYP